MMPLEDVTVEVFSHCAGSCTGCLITAGERRQVVPVMSPAAFGRAMDCVSVQGQKIGVEYRAILGPGDLGRLPSEILRPYVVSATGRGIRLGVTLTLAADDEDRYRRALDMLLESDPGTVLDITVDPLRLERDAGYGTRLRTAINSGARVYLTVLLSRAVMDRFTPEVLAGLCATKLDGHPVTLGFTPTLENIERANYRYSVIGAAGYARAFHAAVPAFAARLEKDLERFRAEGSFLDFLSQRFHIGPGLEVYPVAYTAFGEVTLDRRNGGTALGSLHQWSLAECVDGDAAQHLSALNAAWLDRGGFGCEGCEFRRGCLFNGIGLVRRLYRGHEAKTGSCYGPKGLLQ